MCLHDATSADEALLFSLRRNFLLGQHEQAAQRSPSLLVLFDEWKKVFYTSESQGFPFNYFQQNEYKVGCLNSKTTPSWTTQWGGIIFISGRWNQPWGTSGLISLDPERRIWMFVFIHMHNFSRRSQWQKKKVAKSTIFTRWLKLGCESDFYASSYYSLPSVGHVVTGKSGATLTFDSTRRLQRNHVSYQITGSDFCTQADGSQGSMRRKKDIKYWEKSTWNRRFHLF